jgi:hypothetical protein
MATEIDIAVTTTTYDVTIVAEPNEYIVNITTGGGGGGVQSVTGTTVDNTDPLNPVVGVPTFQQVTDAGATTDNTIYVSDGTNETSIQNSQVQILDGLGSYAQMGAQGAVFVNGDGTGADQCSVSLAAAWSTQQTGLFLSTQDGIGAAALEIKLASEYYTDLPIENIVSNYFIPFKPSGDYTLATLDDIGGGGVPYTGATQDVDLGEFGLLTGNIEFDNTPTNIPTAAGSMVWNDTDGTVDLKLKGANVTLQIGQEQVIRVVNKTATNVNLLEANYQAVRVTGAQGQRLKVDLAQATTDTLSAETIGLVTETINNNQEGFITTSGLIRGINTTGSLQSETWADGDVLYLSPTVAGRVTKVKPTAPNHLVIIGYVIHAHATQGTIFVKVDNGYELDELHNVKITTAANGQALTYTSATDIWENKTIIQDSITDGVTTVAPSQNSVFDALQFTRKLITNGTGSVTGTTSETILTSLTIPANTLDSKCFIWSTMDYFKTNSGSCTLRLYVNSANSLSGATLIGFLTLGSNRNASFNRKLYLNGTTLDFLVSSTSNSQINNEFIEALFGASTTLTVDPTANIFLIYTTQNDVVGTVATSKQATVQKMKLN